MICPTPSPQDFESIADATKSMVKHQNERLPGVGLQRMGLMIDVRDLYFWGGCAGVRVCGAGDVFFGEVFGDEVGPGGGHQLAVKPGRRTARLTLLLPNPSLTRASRSNDVSLLGSAAATQYDKDSRQKRNNAYEKSRNT